MYDHFVIGGKIPSGSFDPFVIGGQIPSRTFDHPLGSSGPFFIDG